MSAQAPVGAAAAAQSCSTPFLVGLAERAFIGCDRLGASIGRRAMMFITRVNALTSRWVAVDAMAGLPKLSFNWTMPREACESPDSLAGYWTSVLGDQRKGIARHSTNGADDPGLHEEQDEHEEGKCHETHRSPLQRSAERR